MKRSALASGKSKLYFFTTIFRQAYYELLFHITRIISLIVDRADDSVVHRRVTRAW